MLDKLAVVFGERRRKMAVDIEFSDHCTFHEDRYDDLGLGFDGTREIARVGVYIVHHDGLRGGDGCPADPWCKGMRLCGVSAPT